MAQQLLQIRVFRSVVARFRSLGNLYVCDRREGLPRRSGICSLRRNNLGSAAQ